MLGAGCHDDMAVAAAFDEKVAFALTPLRADADAHRNSIFTVMMRDALDDMLIFAVARAAYYRDMSPRHQALPTGAMHECRKMMYAAGPLAAFRAAAKR